MSTPSRKALNFAEFLQRWESPLTGTGGKDVKRSGRIWLDWAAEGDLTGLGSTAGRSRRELWRYVLQMAAEREIAVRVLVELRELLLEFAPTWYAAEQHERVESALELLRRL